MFTADTTGWSRRKRLLRFMLQLFAIAIVVFGFFALIGLVEQIEAAGGETEQVDLTEGQRDFLYHLDALYQTIDFWGAQGVGGEETGTVFWRVLWNFVARSDAGIPEVCDDLGDDAAYEQNVIGWLFNQLAEQYAGVHVYGYDGC